MYSLLAATPSFNEANNLIIIAPLFKGQIFSTCFCCKLQISKTFYTQDTRTVSFDFEERLRSWEMKFL